MRLDDVLTWLVRATGLEPKLLSIAAILVAYVAALAVNLREANGDAEPDLGELKAQLDRIEERVNRPQGFTLPRPKIPEHREMVDVAKPETESSKRARDTFLETLGKSGRSRG